MLSQTEIRSFIRPSHIDLGAQAFGPSPIFPGTLADRRIENDSAQTWSGTHMKCWHCRQRLKFLCHNTGPESFIFHLELVFMADLGTITIPNFLPLSPQISHLTVWPGRLCYVNSIPCTPQNFPLCPITEKHRQIVEDVWRKWLVYWLSCGIQVGCAWIQL